MTRASASERHVTRKQGRVVSNRIRPKSAKSRYKAAIKLRWRQRTETLPVYDQIIKLSEMGSKVVIPLRILNLLLMWVTSWSCLSCGIFAKSYRRPNIVFILTDDLDVVIGGLVSELIVFMHQSILSMNLFSQLLILFGHLFQSYHWEKMW